MCCQILQFLKNVVISVVSFMTFILLYWTMYLPALVLRQIVVFLARMLKPEFGRALSPLSSSLAVDDMYNQPTGTILTVFVFQSALDIPAFKKRVQSFVESKEDKCAEFRQYLTKWMGFYFWKWDPNFDFESHFSINSDPMTQEELGDFARTQITKPYSKKTPLWEFTVCSNVQLENKEIPSSGLILRFHHSMADGYSILKVIDIIGRSQDPKRAKSLFLSTSKAGHVSRSKCQTILYLLRSFFLGPGEFVKVVLSTTTPSRWRVLRSSADKKYVDAVTDEVFLDDFTITAKQLQVSTTSLILSVYAGAIRKIMVQQNEKIPRDFVVSSPLPLPNRPDYPTNHMGCAVYYLPVHIEDRMERVNYVEKELVKLQNSSQILAGWWVSNFVGILIGLLPVWPNNPLSHIMFSNLPGPRERIDFFDTPVRSIYASGGIPNSMCSAILTSHSYGGRSMLRVVADTNLFKNQLEAQQLIDAAVEEVNNYVKLADITSNFKDENSPLCEVTTIK